MTVEDYMAHFKWADDYMDPDDRIDFHYAGPRPKNVSEAWLITLAKWQVMKREGFDYDDNGGVNTCGLCMLYNKDACDHCPIKEYTGMPWCGESPFSYYLDYDSDAGLVDEEIEFLKQVYDWCLAGKPERRNLKEEKE